MLEKTEAPNKIGQPRDMGNVGHKTQNKENQNKTENRTMSNTDLNLRQT